MSSLPANGRPQQSEPAQRPNGTAAEVAPRQIVELVAVTLAWWRQVDEAGLHVHGRRYIPGSAQVAQLTRVLRNDTRRVGEVLKASRKTTAARKTAADRQWVSL